MSRAYKIKIKESLSKIIRASDHVATCLEVLSVLPEAEMADLLAAELEKQGFHREGQTMIRVEGEVRITVDLTDGGVRVEAESEQQVDLETTREGTAYDDAGPGAERVRESLRAQAQASLENQAEQQRNAMQQQVTDALEGVLADLRQQLNQAVNQATAEALKVKAKRMGNIKSMAQDEASGSLTIVVEV